MIKLKAIETFSYYNVFSGTVSVKKDTIYAGQISCSGDNEYFIFFSDNKWNRLLLEYFKPEEV